jgi:hypothetical protein
LATEIKGNWEPDQKRRKIYVKEEEEKIK